MKRRIEHRVPLSDGALMVLKRARDKGSDQGAIFKGLGKGRLSGRAIEGLLHRTLGVP